MNNKTGEGGAWEATRYLHSLKVSFHKILITKGKRVTLQWRTLADSMLTKLSNLTPIMGQNDIKCLWYVKWKGQNITSVVFLWRKHNLNWIRRKCQVILNWGAFCQTVDQNFPKDQYYKTQRKAPSEAIPDCRRLKKRDNGHAPGFLLL